MLIDVGYNIRKNCGNLSPQLQGGPDDWQKGQILNTDDNLAVQCQHQQQDNLGSQWNNIQRGGQTGTSSQGKSYGNAVNYIQNYVDKGHTTDGRATSYNLPPI